MYKQVLDPVGNSLFLSAIFAALPLIALFILLGGLKWKAHFAALALTTTSPGPACGRGSACFGWSSGQPCGKPFASAPPNLPAHHDTVRGTTCTSRN